MNWIDGILVALLLAVVIVGSKKGLIRELSATVVFFAAIVLTVRYIDNFAVWVYEQLGGSPLVSAFLSFILLLAGAYVAFKLLGMLFYKIATVKEDKKRDQMGGALVGFVRGWVAVSFLTLVIFTLPLPDWFYTSFENSFFGPTVAKTIPMFYDVTAKLDKNGGTFMEKMESTLLPSSMSEGSEMSEERTEAHRVIYQMDRFFNTDTPTS
jgi:uncharacterized membrane protein required for colicin V production